MSDESASPALQTMPPAPATVPPVPFAGYKDDDLVYVDPEKRIVVGLVEWSNSGRPKSLQRKEEEIDEDESPPKTKDGKPPFRRPRRIRIRYYPWGTYRAMKRLFKIEGKVPETRGNASLDDILPKALTEPFWD